MVLDSSAFSDQIKPFIHPQQNCNYAKIEEKPELKPAAVLIALIDMEDLGLSVLLTTRTKHLHNHAGQISLPGGMMDKIDSSPIDTAIRETHEEVGISPKFIEIVGGLDHYPTKTGFIISPIVGRILPGFSLDPDPFEVDEIFMVPLSFLFDEKNHEQHTYHDQTHDGQKRTHNYTQINYGDKRIWGITAAILVNFYKRLKDNHPLFCELVL